MIKLKRTLMAAALALPFMTSRLLADPEAVPELTSELGPSLLKLAGALVFILLVIYGSVWLMKRFSLGRLAGGGEMISIVDKRHLSPKQAIYLIKVGRTHLLVGSSEAGLSKIGDVTPEDVAPPSPGTPERSSESKFNRVLKQARTTFLPLLRSKEAGVEIDN